MIGMVIKVLTGIEFFIAILMIAVILLQQSKSTGGLGSMAGDVGENVLGAGASSFFRRFTIVLASLFLGLTLVLAIITGRRPEGGTWSFGERQQPQKSEQQMAPGEQGTKPGAGKSESTGASGQGKQLSASEDEQNEDSDDAAGKSE